MRTGIATVPLDTGHCPPWLFERMQRLGRAIALAVVEEFGPDELLRRLSDPIWFQSLGCVMGFDYNSSGLTTTTLGALKEGIRGLEGQLGIFVCGGKGKTSKKTPEQILSWGEFLGFSLETIDRLTYASKMAAKVDSCLVQDGFQIYHHNLIFSKKGKWCVVQQGMSTTLQKARRYHWLSSGVKDFVEEPHSGIISQGKARTLNLIAKESKENKQTSFAQVKEEPKTFLKNMQLVQQKMQDTGLVQRARVPGFAIMELRDVEFHWHPVAQERFDLKRLAKIVSSAHRAQPNDFKGLVYLKGVGPKTIRALSLVSEVIYGAKPSYEDPARYTFSIGGKDGTPYPVNRAVYDKVLGVMEKGIKKSTVSLKEKENALQRLAKF